MKNFLFTISMLLFSFISNAQTTFQKSYGGIGNERGYFAQQTDDSGFIIGGWSTSYGTYCSDFYLVKTDSVGDTLWSRNFGLPMSCDYGASGQQTLDGGYIIIGEVHLDIYIVKVNSLGDTVWSKLFGTIDYESPNFIKQTADSGYIIVGHRTLSSPSSINVFVMKTNNLGDTLWTNTYGGPGTDNGSSIQPTNDGGYIITGTSDFGNKELYLIKIDSVGNLMWSKSYGGAGNDYGSFIQATNDGGYIVIGSTNSFGAGDYDILLIHTDSVGTLLWSKTFGGTGIDRGNSIHKTIDGGYILIGSTNSFGAGNDDIYLLKTNGSGDTLWTKTIGGTDYDLGSSVNLTNDNGYILGCSSFSFNLSYGEMFLVKLDSTGFTNCNEYFTNTIVTTPVINISNPLTVSTWGNLYEYAESMQINEGAYVITACTSVGMNYYLDDASHNIFPNPSTGYFVITFPRLINKGMIEICNVIGKNLFSEQIISQSKKEIYIKNVSSGIYFVKVFDGEKYYCKKLIIEYD